MPCFSRKFLPYGMLNGVGLADVYVLSDRHVAYGKKPGDKDAAPEE